MVSGKKKFLGYLFRLLRKIILSFLIVFLLAFLIIQLPPVQQRIATTIKEKLLTPKGIENVCFEGLRLTITGKIKISELYIPDVNNQVLLKAKRIKTRLKVWQLLKGNLFFSSVELSGVECNLISDSTGTPNFRYIVDAFKKQAPSTGKKMNLSLSKLFLKDVSFNFLSKESGLSLSVQLDNLSLYSGNKTLPDSLFIINQLTISDSRVRLEIPENNLETEIGKEKPAQTKSNQLPSFRVEELNLNKVFFSLKQQNLLTLECNSGSTGIEEVFVSLSGSLIEAGSVSLTKSVCQINLSEQASHDTALIVDSPAKNTIETLRELNYSGGWNIHANSVRLSKNRFNLEFSNEIKTNIFNPKNFSINDLGLNCQNVSLFNSNLKADITKLSCSVDSSLEIKKFHSKATFSENGWNLKDLLLKTENSKIILTSELLFQKKEMVQCIKILKAEGTLSPTELAYFSGFQPDSLPISTREPLEISIDAERNNNELILNTASLKQGKFFNLQSTGKYSREDKKDLAFFEFSIDTLTINKNFIPKNFYPENIQIPDNINASGKLKGKTKDCSVNLRITSVPGSVNTSFRVTDSANSYKCSGKLETRLPGLGKLKNDSLIASLYSLMDFHLLFNRKFQPESVQIDLIADTIIYDYHKFSGLQLTASYNSKLLLLSSELNDSLVNFKIDLQGRISESFNLNYNLLIGQLNASVLNPRLQHVTLTGNLNGNVNGTGADSLFLSGKLQGMKIKNPKQTLLLSVLDYSYNKKLPTQNLKLKSDEFELEFSTNLANDSILPSVKRSITELLQGKGHINDSQKKLTLNAKINQTEFLMPFLWFIDTLDMQKLELDFDLYRSLKLDAAIASISMGKMGFQETVFNLIANDSVKNTHLKISKVQSESFSTSSLVFDAAKESSAIKAKLTFFDLDNKIHTNVVFNPSFNQDSIVILILPENFYLGGITWDLGPKARIVYYPSQNDFCAYGIKLAEKEQRVAISGCKENLNLILQNIRLTEFSNLIELSDSIKITGGLLSMNCKFNLNNKLLIDKGTFQVNELSVNKKAFGNLNAEFSHPNPNRLKTTAILVNDNDRFEISGYTDLDAGKTFSKYSIRFNVPEMVSYSLFLNPLGITILNGSSKGSVDYSGDLSTPKLNGKIELAGVTLEYLKTETQLTFPDEKIRIEDNTWIFKNIKIQDAQKNELKINGSISGINFENQTFNLNMKSDNFVLMNNTEKDNPDLFGILAIGADITLNGTTLLPQIDALIRIHDKTNITYSMPGNELLVNTGEGVVSFVNNPQNNRDTQQNEFSQISDSVSKVLKGWELNARLIFNKDARYKIITNPQSGDFARFGLNGAVKYVYLNNSQEELNGNLEIIDGLYQISFYNMIKKDFYVVEGSSVLFSGNLQNTNLDIVARSIVRTNSLALVSNEVGSMTNEEKNIYNKRLPYEVLFKVKGLLVSPEVGFGIDLPDEHKMNYPIIASKLSKLESPETEQERNMQVFALLVTGSFIADNTNVSSASSSENFATTAARNSVNGILTQQLNNFSEQYIRFFNVNMGLNSYEDYSGGTSEIRTDLDIGISKKMFNDRFTFEMQSSINMGNQGDLMPGQSSYNTDVLMYYDIKTDGTSRVKAFNVVTYDMFEGSDINNSGFGIVFSRDFNSFRKQKTGVENDSLLKNE